MNVIDLVRDDVMELFPEFTQNKSATYCTLTWIFPNHFDPNFDTFSLQVSKLGFMIG